MASHKLEVREDDIHSLPRNQIQEKLAQIFDAEKPPTAIVAGNDLVLREILSYLKKQKSRFPGKWPLSALMMSLIRSFMNHPSQQLDNPYSKWELKQQSYY